MGTRKALSKGASARGGPLDESPGLGSMLDDSRLIAIDRLAGPVGYVDRALRIRYASDALGEWLAGAAGPLSGQALADLLGETALERVRGHFDAAFEGRSVTYRDRLGPSGSHTRFYDVHLVPDVDSEGVVEGVLMLASTSAHSEADDAGAVDSAAALRIADEKLTSAYAELRESEERFRNLIEGSVQGIIILSSDWKPLFVNEAYARIFGYGAPEDVLALDNVNHHVAPHEIERVKRYAQARLRGEPVPTHYEYDAVKIDGTQITLSRSVRSITWKGQPALQSTVFDITPRVQAIKSLRESEERYRNLFEGSVQAIVILSPTWEPLFANRAYLTMLGYESFEELSASPSVRTNVAEHDMERLRSYTRARMRGEPAPDIYECDLIRKDGTVITLLRNSRVINWRGEPAIQTTSVDISDRKHAEERLKRLNEELEERVAARTMQLEAANQELEAFSYSVSHDLRAPLRHIAGFSSLLEKSGGAKFDEESRRYVSLIAESVDRMDNLIFDLLEFSRIGRTAMQCTDIDLDAMIDRVCTDLEPDTAGRDIVWDRTPVPNVKGDPQLMRLVLMNLLSNAVKFTRGRNPAHISIGSHEDRERRERVFYVRDNGVGFDMKYADKLFGAFQRLHSRDQFEGSGIGLANVRRIVHRHGGRTWAESRDGAGATAYFTLPMIAETVTGERP